MSLDKENSVTGTHAPVSYGQVQRAVTSHPSSPPLETLPPGSSSPTCACNAWQDFPSLGAQRQPARKATEDSQSKQHLQMRCGPDFVPTAAPSKDAWASVVKSGLHCGGAPPPPATTQRSDSMRPVALEPPATAAEPRAEPEEDAPACGSKPSPLALDTQIVCCSKPSPLALETALEPRSAPAEKEPPRTALSIVPPERVPINCTTIIVGPISSVTTPTAAARHGAASNFESACGSTPSPLALELRSFSAPDTAPAIRMPNSDPAAPIGSPSARRPGRILTAADVLRSGRRSCGSGGFPSSLPPVPLQCAPSPRAASPVTSFGDSSDDEGEDEDDEEDEDARHSAATTREASPTDSPRPFPASTALPATALLATALLAPPVVGGAVSGGAVSGGAVSGARAPRLGLDGLSAVSGSAVADSVAAGSAVADSAAAGSAVSGSTVKGQMMPPKRTKVIEKAMEAPSKAPSKAMDAPSKVIEKAMEAPSKAPSKAMDAPSKAMDARSSKEFYHSLMDAPKVPTTAPRAPAYESTRPPPTTAPRAPAYESTRPPPKPKITKGTKLRHGWTAVMGTTARRDGHGWTAAAMARVPTMARGAGLMGHGAAVGVVVPIMARGGAHHGAAVGAVVPIMAPPPPPPPMLFEGYRSSLVMPSAAAMACLDHMVAEYYHKAMRESSAMDAPAQALMGHVQHAVSGLWGNHARIACFGSRATGLACATSDVDLVVTGVPGIDPATVPQLWRHAPVTVDDQCAALEDLQPLILSLPGVLSATINRAAVPVLAITADVRVLQRLQPSSAAHDGAHGGAHDGGNCTSAATGADAPTTAPATAPATALLHLDISIHSERHRGLLAAQHVRWLHALLPPLAPLVVMLKALLHRHGLKSTFTGGLSSYALVIMVARFLMGRPRLRCRLWAPTTAPAEKGSISHAEMAAAEAEARATLGAALRAAAQRASSWADCPADVERTRCIGQPAPTADETRATSDDETPVTTPVATPDAAALSDATGAVTGAGATQCSAEGTEDSAGAHDGAHTGVGAGALSRAPASLGQLFVEVLAFYGQIFEPSSHALVGLTGAGVPPPPGYGFATRHELAPMLSMLNNGFGGFGVSPQPDPFAMEPLVVLDPVDPSNNVGKSCYRVAAVQRLCADTARATLALAEESARCPQKVPSATLAEAILGVPPSQMA